jgi:hypothetical protein
LSFQGHFQQYPCMPTAGKWRASERLLINASRKRTFLPYTTYFPCVRLRPTTAHKTVRTCDHVIHHYIVRHTFIILERLYDNACMCGRVRACIISISVFDNNVVLEFVRTQQCYISSTPVCANNQFVRFQIFFFFLNSCKIQTHS